LKGIRRRASFTGTKLGGGKKLETESEGGQKFLPLQPPSFLPARAEKFWFLPHEARQSEFAVRIFVKISSDFNQKAPPLNFANASLN